MGSIRLFPLFVVLLMDKLQKVATSARHALEDLRVGIADLGFENDFNSTLHRIEQVLAALSVELPKASLRRGFGGPDLKRKVRRQGDKIEELTEKVRELENAKTSGRIHNLWFVRVCHSPPGIVPRTLAQWLRDFPTKETQSVSHTYVGRVLDGYVEVVKELNKAEVSKLVTVAACNTDSAESLPIYFKHIHYEASTAV